jgi:hypothetical protein
VVVLVAGAGATWTSASYAGTVALQPSAASKDYAVASDAPMPPNPTPAQVQVVTRADTEKGYILQHPGHRRTDYIYDSDNVYMAHVRCQGSRCQTIAQVKAQLHQYVVGRNSKRWQITLHASRYSGTEGYQTSYFYACAVNISRAKDKYCPEKYSDGADSNESSTFYNGEVLNRSFGSTNGVTKFPMVKVTVLFLCNCNATPVVKFRMWDVCVKAKSTKLCKHSDNG